MMFAEDMQRRTLLLASLAALVPLTCCSPSLTDERFAEADLKGLVERVTKRRMGFAVGHQGARQPTVVAFDPMCSHCHLLWTALVPLWPDFGFVWMPAGTRRESLSRGVALLSCANPVATMNALVASAGDFRVVTEDEGRMAAAASAVRAFSSNLEELGVTALPFVVASNIQDRRLRAHTGRMSASEYRDWIGAPATG